MRQLQVKERSEECASHGVGGMPIRSCAVRREGNSRPNPRVSLNVLFLQGEQTNPINVSSR